MTAGDSHDPNIAFDELSAEDRRVLDSLMTESGLDAEAVAALPAADQPRAARLLDMMALLSDYPVEDADETLIHATLARIDRHEDERSARLAFDAHQDEAATSPRRIRLPDFMTVAAVLLIAASVGWPIMSQLRNRSLDMACANNLRQMGFAFGTYAADHAGAMPVARAGANLTWDTIRNVINLGPLVSGGYCEHGHLNCPAVDHQADASYSYQMQQEGASSMWGAGPGMTLVLGDRNPLIDAYRGGEHVPSLATSLNHGGRGQNVLSSDGADIWLEDPVIGQGDNIWLTDGMSELEAGMRPVAGDTFLVH